MSIYSIDSFLKIFFKYFMVYKFQFDNQTGPVDLEVKNINSKLIKTSKMGAACTSAFTTIKFPDLSSKNLYRLEKQQKQIQDKNVDQLGRRIFCNNEPLIKTHSKLLGYLIQSGKNNKFKDPNFQLAGQHLSNLYDYKRKSMKLYTNQNKPGLSVLEQQDVELAYLSSVMFFLCQNKELLRRRILLNDEINDKQLYGFRLFCNGEEHNVIVDDVVPVTLDNDLKYCLVKEKQLWPPLLQKAWCKMIGNYDHAKGLSPEQCFEEITGLPASSIRIDTLNQMNIYSDLLKLQNAGNWLCVVAYHGTQTLKSGHVFVIEKFDDQSICLASPFTKFNQPTKDQTSPGCLKIQFHRFRTLFEYLIIGYAVKGYAPVSKRVVCQKREEKLFEIDVGQKEDISIRFTQFFNGYLDDQDKSNYDYSPLVTFELYDSKGILHFCQGCDKLYSGAHSVYFSKSIFHTLNKGVYYLRLQVDWQRPDRMKLGNLVIYASQHSVQIQQVVDKNKIYELHRKTLQNPKSVVINDETDEKSNEYQLRFIEKKTNILISIQSKIQTLLSLELNFSKSQNFRVKYGKLENDKKVRINLGPNEVKFLQIMPEQVKSQFRIQPFTVKKIQIQPK